MTKVELHKLILKAMGHAAKTGVEMMGGKDGDIFDSPEYRQLEKYLTEEESC